MPTTKEISEEIRKIRHSTGLKQKEFVELYNDTEPCDARITVTDLSKYEHGINSISALKFMKMQLLTKKRS